MIRHARAASTPTVLTLAISVIEFAFFALLVASIGCSPLTQACLLAACEAAIALAVIAIRAEEEQSTALREKAKPLLQNNFAMRRHAGMQAATGQRRGFVAG